MSLTEEEKKKVIEVLDSVSEKAEETSEGEEKPEGEKPEGEEEKPAE